MHTRAKSDRKLLLDEREAFEPLLEKRIRVLRPDVQAGASLAGKDSSEASSTISKASPCGDVLFPGDLRVVGFLIGFGSEERMATAPLQINREALQGHSGFSEGSRNNLASKVS